MGITLNLQTFVGLALGVDTFLCSQFYRSAFGNGDNHVCRLVLTIIGTAIMLIELLNATVFLSVAFSFDEWDRSDTIKRLARLPLLRPFVFFINITLVGVLIEAALSVAYFAAFLSFLPPKRSQSFFILGLMYIIGTGLSLLFWWSDYVRLSELKDPSVVVAQRQPQQRLYIEPSELPLVEDRIFPSDEDLVFTMECDVCQDDVLRSDGCGKCTCSVCLESMNGKQVAAFYQCQVHLYHIGCVKRLIDANKRLGFTQCPQCRALEVGSEITEADIRFLRMVERI